MKFKALFETQCVCVKMIVGEIVVIKSPYKTSLFTTRVGRVAGPTLLDEMLCTAFCGGGASTCAVNCLIVTITIKIKLK